MATLPVVEGGQMMLRGAQGGVPMAQVSAGQVEPIAARAAAQQAGTLAQMLDRMSASAFQEAGRLAPIEAMLRLAGNTFSTSAKAARRSATMNSEPSPVVPNSVTPSQPSSIATAASDTTPSR